MGKHKEKYRSIKLINHTDGIDTVTARHLAMYYDNYYFYLFILYLMCEVSVICHLKNGLDFSLIFTEIYV